MKISKFIAVAILGILITGTSYATTTTTTTEVIVEANGYGQDYDSAVMNAIENAIRQTSDIVVSREMPELEATIKAETELKAEKKGLFNKESLDVSKKDNGSIKIKTVNAKYSGKVKSYEVIKEEKAKDGKISVRIKAKVEKISEYKSSELVKKAQYKLAIMPIKGNSSYMCLGSKMNLKDLDSKINSKLSNRLVKSGKFSVVNRANLDDYANEASLIAYDLTNKKDQNKLQNIAAADYMIVGNISEFSAARKSEYLDITGETETSNRGSITFDYSIIELATTEVIFSDYAEASFKNDKKSTNCHKMLDMMLEKIANDVTKDSLETLFPGYEFEAQAKKKSKKLSTPKKAVSNEVKQKQTVKLPFD